MTTSAAVQNIDKAIANSHDAGDFCAAFDVVKISSTGGGYIDLFLPHNAGQAVADAINAALAPAEGVL